jgi:nicotinate-nucleotide pyrophosphorylase (carboxylating)
MNGIFMKNVKTLIKLALEEDNAFKDITSLEFVPKDKNASAVLIANKSGVLCGVDIFEEVFKTIDKKCLIKRKLNDGARLKKGDKILTIFAKAQSILSAERTALNFLQHLSGISTITNIFVSSLGRETKTKIFDTRKTIPAYRELAKYAVRTGGGKNHRMSLADMALVKDNHLSLTKDLTEKIKQFRKKHKKIPIEIECENLKQVEQALNAKADIIMLDNFNFETAKKAVLFIRKNSQAKYKPEIEISGGVNFENAKRFAKLNAERISVGMITHSAEALDITLEIEIN